MERRSGLWIASTPEKNWVVQGRPVINRKLDSSLAFDGGMHQLWEGFGCGVSEMGWEALQALSGAERKRATNALFNREEGCCFHYARLPVGASNLAVSPYSCNESAGDLAMKQFSITRDRERLHPFLRLPLERIRKFKVLACPWSPPEWMMTRIDGVGRIGWTPAMLDAYALYLARFVEEYRRIGIAIDHLIVQNDPVTGRRNPGCMWTGAQLRDFIRNHLGPVFRKRRLATKLWVGSFEAARYAEVVLPILSDTLAMQFVTGVACQHGGLPLLERIRRAFPDILLMHSDCGGGNGDNTWIQGHHTFAVVRKAIADGASSCIYDNAVFFQGGRDAEGLGRNSLLAVDRENRRFAVTPDYCVFRHFSAWVDRYAVRLGLVGEWADRAVAFFNEADESRILVIHNPDGESRRVVLEDGERRLVLMLAPRSFNTVIV